MSPHTEIKWTREERIDALNMIIEAYGDAVNRAFHSRHDDDGWTRKRIRAALDCDIEKYCYAKGCLEAFTSKNAVKEGFMAEHEFSRNFEWKAEKRWNRYFG